MTEKQDDVQPDNGWAEEWWRDYRAAHPEDDDPKTGLPKSEQHFSEPAFSEQRFFRAAFSEQHFSEPGFSRPAFSGAVKGGRMTARDMNLLNDALDAYAVVTGVTLTEAQREEAWLRLGFYRCAATTAAGTRCSQVLKAGRSCGYHGGRNMDDQREQHDERDQRTTIHDDVDDSRVVEPLPSPYADRSYRPRVLPTWAEEWERCMSPDWDGTLRQYRI